MKLTLMSKKETMEILKQVLTLADNLELENTYDAKTRIIGIRIPMFREIEDSSPHPKKEEVGEK